MTENQTPIISPIIALLKSRAFIVMIVTALVNMIIIAVPDFAQYRDDLIKLVSGLALALIIKIGGEDIAKTTAQAKVDVAAHQAVAAQHMAVAALASKSVTLEDDGDTRPLTPPYTGELPHR